MERRFVCVFLYDWWFQRTQDTRPLVEDMCDFYASGSGYMYDSYYTEVTLIHAYTVCTPDITRLWLHYLNLKWLE